MPQSWTQLMTKFKQNSGKELTRIVHHMRPGYQFMAGKGCLTLSATICIQDTIDMANTCLVCERLMCLGEECLAHLALFHLQL